MVGNGHLADVVQQHTALEHAHQAAVQPAAERRQVHRLLGEGAHIVLHAQQVLPGLQAALLGHLGQGENQHVLGLSLVGVVQPLRLLQLLLHGQVMTGHVIGAVLGFLAAQGKPGPAEQFLGQQRPRHTLIRATIGAGGQPLGVVSRREQHYLDVRRGRLGAELGAKTHAGAVWEQGIDKQEIGWEMLELIQGLVHPAGLATLQFLGREGRPVSRSLCGCVGYNQDPRGLLALRRLADLEGPTRQVGQVQHPNQAGRSGSAVAAGRIEKRAQGRHHGLRRRVTIAWVHRHHLVDDGFELERDLRPQLVQGHWRLALAGQQFLDDRAVTGKGLLPRQQPVENAAQPVDIRADVHRPGVACLLGRHVIDAAEHHVSLGVPAAANAGQAEIEDLDLVLGRQQQVRRLHVAMHQAVLVRVLQAAGRLAEVLAGLGDRQRTVVEDVLLEVLAGHKLHDQVAEHFLIGVGHRHLAGVEREHDVRVAEHGRGLHLAVEALEKD